MFSQYITMSFALFTGSSEIAEEAGAAAQPG
jgi:hypothetical protein